MLDEVVETLYNIQKKTLFGWKNIKIPDIDSDYHDIQGQLNIMRESFDSFYIVEQILSALREYRKPITYRNKKIEIGISNHQVVFCIKKYKNSNFYEYFHTFGEIIKHIDKTTTKYKISIKYI